MASNKNWFQRIFARTESIPTQQNIPLNEESAQLLKTLLVKDWSQKTLAQFTGKNYTIATSLANKFSQAVTTRQEYLRASNEMRRYYLVHGILNLVADDILSPSEEGNTIDLSSNNPKIQKELDYLMDRFDLSSLLYDIILDLLDFGEYTLRIKTEVGKGIIDVVDDVEPMSILALYELGYPKSYMVYDQGGYFIKPASSYIHFCNGLHKERIKIIDYFGGSPQVEDEEAFDRLPDYARIGTPLLYGALSKIRELQILEQLIPAQKLNEITQSQIVSLNVPPSMPPDKVFETVRRYEEMLNVAQGIDYEAGQISLAEILSVAGKIRVVPNFNQEKGALEKLDIRNFQAIDDLVGSINDVRKMILSSIGIPPWLMFGDSGMESGTSKNDSLRAYSRYTRKIKTYQKEIKRGITQFVLIHLLNKGFKDISFEDFSINFGDTLISVGDLEKLEFLDAKQEIITKNLDFINTIKENELLKDYIDHDALIEWIVEKLSFIADGTPFITRQKQVTATDDTIKQSSNQEEEPAEIEEPSKEKRPSRKKKEPIEKEGSKEHSQEMTLPEEPEEDFDINQSDDFVSPSYLRNLRRWS
jgi:hypothetical protein